jgi:ferric-dicitrate binding protein FerR (iron transport regulator)
MGTTDQAARAAPYLQELVDNDYVQENLREGLDRLRAAYARARKRRVEPTRDEKLRRQLRDAARSISEAASALRSGRRKPERRWGTRLAVVAGLAVAGGAAGLWARERLGDQAGSNAGTPGLS